VRVFDADVTTLIRLTPLPATALTPPSTGEVYSSPVRGRIVNPLHIYSTLLPFSPESETAIRTLWPTQADTILAHGHLGYWERLHWTPEAGMEGSILGTFKHPSGQSLYLMTFQYNNETLYVPINMGAVAVSQ
jgi:hypothetical protein